jgi:hypothetical protein
VTANPDAPAIITLPPLSGYLCTTYRTTLGRSAVVEPLVSLLDVGEEPIRIVPTGNGGVVSYTISVPAELRNIIILDASHPIRRLVHLDATIRDAGELPQVKRCGGLANLKRFDQVAIHQMFAGGGRSTMAADFSRAPGERCVTREVAEVVRSIPETEAVLVFVYKDRDGVQYRKALIDDLEAAGISTTAKVTVGDTQRDRINVLTWGNEVSIR